MAFLKVEVFIPPADQDRLIEALNRAGLLGQGNYDYVFAATEVTGHWRPLEGAEPAIGTIDQLSREKELKLEFRIPADRRDETDTIIRQHHPYEEPAINFIALV